MKNTVQSLNDVKDNLTVTIDGKNELEATINQLRSDKEKLEAEIQSIKENGNTFLSSALLYLTFGFQKLYSNYNVVIKTYLYKIIQM